MPKKDLAIEVNKRLTKAFPVPETPLKHHNAYELLIAVMLSPQTLDTTTNKVTPVLFSMYKNFQELANASWEDVDKLLKGINYHRTKSRNIVKASQLILSNFNGEIPCTMEGLIKLPGVGRKVANVMINEWFVRHGEAEPVGFVVDTHVLRVSHRLGLSKNTAPAKVEQDLMKLYPKSEWVDGSLRLIFHGRKTCISRRPKCEICPLKDICPKIGVDPEIKLHSVGTLVI